MVTLHLRRFMCVVLTLTATAAYGADSWLGNQVMPRTPNLQILVGSRVMGGVHDIAWPATVQRREGQWLWITDRSGYSKQPIDGWLNTEDVIKLEEAPTYYGELIVTSKEGWVYWLRGIYWEAQSEMPLAISDFQQAINLDAKLADSHLRLGLAEAKSAQAESGRPWEERFRSAVALRRENAQVFFDWGEALRVAYEPAKTPDEKKDCFSDAEKHYATARTYNSECHSIHLGWGELMLARGKKQEAQKIDFTRPLQDAIEHFTTLADAIGHFDQAIKCNPQAVDAYRDRGEAYRMLEQFELAMQSARRACVLADYRAPLSLKVLASVYYDLEQYKPAVDYITQAANYSSGSTQNEILQLKNLYAATYKADLVSSAKASLAGTASTAKTLKTREIPWGLRDLQGSDPDFQRRIEALIPEVTPLSLSAAPE